MIETMGQRPRQPPVQCWGCGGDHMYRDFPQKSEKLRTVHNAQQDGRNVPRIYVALNNKQVEF